MNKGNFRKEQWKMLLITMFCYMFFYTGRHNFGWAARNMATDLGISYSSVGWISFAMLIGYAIGQLVNGNLADRFNPRVMITLGAILSVLTNFAISFSSTYTSILILWAMNGYFQSMAWAPGSRLISNWWAREERGKAFGFYTMAAGSSSVITFLLSIIILQYTSSWHLLFRLPVLLLLLAAVIFYFVARSKPSDNGYDELYPAEPGSTDHSITWQERYKVVFSNRRFMIASIALGFESMARYGLIVWVPVHYLGESAKSGSGHLWASILMPAGMAVGALCFGKLSDSLFKRNRPAAIRAGMLVAAGISLLIYFTPVTNFFAVAVLMFAAGFFVYGPQAGFWPMSSDLLGEKYVATGVGVMNTSAYVFAAFGEPFLGKVIDVTHNTSNVFIVISVISAICVVIISCVDYKEVNIKDEYNFKPALYGKRQNV